MRTAPAAPPPAPLAIRAWLRYDVVARVLKGLRPATVLEIGCGQGAFGSRLAGSVDYLGLEPDPNSFAVAQARIEPRGGTVINGTHEAAPDGRRYDLVCAFEVLEHIEDDKAALAEWIRFVKPGGHLVLSVPAFQERFGPMDEHAGHFRRYEPAQLSGLLLAAGLNDVSVTTYAWPLGYALEAVRNRIDAKKLATAAAAGTPIEQLTAASGRTFQPSRKLSGRAIQAATKPFRLAQRIRPNRGTGLVAVAKLPA